MELSGFGFSMPTIAMIKIGAVNAVAINNLNRSSFDALFVVGPEVTDNSATNGIPQTGQEPGSLYDLSPSQFIGQ